jgi:hypothetical protein
MASIDELLANSARTNADFSQLSNIPKAYYEGQDQAYKQKVRNVFSDENGGLPRDQAGNVDFQKAYEKLVTVGGAPAIESAGSLATSGLTQDRIRYAPTVSAVMEQPGPGSRPGARAPIASPSVSPSANQADSEGGNGAPQGGGLTTVKQVLAAQGIPNDQLETAGASVARQLGLSDPNQAFNKDDPQIRNVLVPAVLQLKRMGIGQVQPPQPGDNPPQGEPSQIISPPSANRTAQAKVAPPLNRGGVVPPQSAAAPMAAAAPQPQQGYRGDPTLGGLIPPGYPDPGAYLARLQAVATSGRVLPEQLKTLEQKIGAIQTAMQPTTEQKNYNFATANPAFDERAQDNATAEARGKVQGETYAKKYESLAEAGTKAQQEIPQLEMLKEQMNDPNFFSGAGEKYNFLYKQLKSAVGIDPNASVPQEFLRKATAANVLGSLGALKGLGQIRVAEIGLAKDASAAPNTSVPANKLLTEMAIRTHQRNADIADLAQAYSQKNGGLDAGFDKIATEYGKKHPLFTDAEIKDWRLAIGQPGAEGQGKGVQDYGKIASSVPGAKQAPDGNFYVPDPRRPGKYLRVVQ